MPDRAVVLLSGGLDSAVTLALARTRGLACAALSFDYAQRHRHELDAARRIADALGADRHATVGLDLRALGGSALTDDALDVPRDRPAHDIGEGVPVTYVPARNIVFLAVGVGWAETLDAGSLWIGVNSVDYSGYPDCRPEFIEAFQEAAARGTSVGAERGRPIRIETPLIEMTKAEIIRAGADLGVDFALTHSCYDPEITPGGEALACGRCDSCLLRARGFREAGVADPTRYAQGITP